MRFTFGTFVLSPGHRVLLKDGRPVPLIPKYFDLLVLLVAERQRAVTRQEIFDRVWADVVVSDGALSQAIRTIRRALSDGPQAAQFIRTVSRHGYQFVGDVVESPDAGPWSAANHVGAGATPTDAQESDVARDQLVAVLLGEHGSAPATEEERYDAALALHELGTDAALRRLADRPGHAEGGAVRDARWMCRRRDARCYPRTDARRRVADPVRLRLRHAGARRPARWFSSTASSASCGIAAAWPAASPSVSRAARLRTPARRSRLRSSVASPAWQGRRIGGVWVARRSRGPRAQLHSSWRSARRMDRRLARRISAARVVPLNVFGRNVSGMAGAPEGLVLGAVLGLGYATATRTLVAGGMASPRGAARVRVVLVTAAAAAIAGLLLALAGRRLVATSLDLVAGAFSGSAVGLAPLARFLGEDSLRPITQAIVSGFEGFMLGVGIAFGLTRRPTRSTRET